MCPIYGQLLLLLLIMFVLLVPSDLYEMTNQRVNQHVGVWPAAKDADCTYLSQQTRWRYVYLIVVVSLLCEFVGLLCVYVTSTACQSVLGEDPSSVVYVTVFSIFVFSSLQGFVVSLRVFPHTNRVSEGRS